MGNIRLNRLERRRTGGNQNRMTLSVPIPKSPSGKVYQKCPNKECTPRLFLMGSAPDSRTIEENNKNRIRRDPGEGETICPYCGNKDLDDNFISFEDVEAIQKLIMWEAEQDVSDYIHDWAKDLNRSLPKGGLISMQVKAETRRRPRPLAIREDLLREMACDVCRREYGVYAIALYCPDCGSPNIHRHFLREVELVTAQTELADQARGEGNIELAYRLLGNAHEDVLTVFETALKTVFRHLVKKHIPEMAAKLCARKAIGNSFQNIERSRTLFSELQFDPYDCLDEKDLETLRTNIVKRHVIGHNLGIADDLYTSEMNDTESGRLVQLLGEDVMRFSQICIRVIERLERELLPHQFIARRP